MVFQRDLVGTAEQIIERLADDPSFDGATELRVALPYGFAEDEYRQILSDIRHAVLPALGWEPGAEQGTDAGAGASITAREVA